MDEWEEGLFLEGEDKISEHFFGRTNVLMIVGKGFDPRACLAIKVLVPVVNHITVYLIDYDDQAFQEDRENQSQSQKNLALIKNICKHIELILIKVNYYEGIGQKRELVISEGVRNAFRQHPINGFQDIIIDISAMPRAVSFSIIKRLEDIKGLNQRISILVCENSDFDDQIEPIISEGSAVYLPGFQTFSTSLEATNYRTIWLPILGMREEAAFNIISEFLKPDEICPVVPFPAISIKRGENILRHHGEAIFRERDVEKRNIIYAPEKYPVLIYQKLYETVKYYEKAFSVIQEEDKCTKYAFSSQASKLMDIGMLLAVMKLCNEKINTGIVVVDNQGYHSIGRYKKEENKLYCLCLDESEFDWD